MKSAVYDHVGQILGALSEVFVLCPSSDYQSPISHSVESLTNSAWYRTGVQMQTAISSHEGKNPHVKRNLPTLF